MNELNLLKALISKPETYKTYQKFLKKEALSELSGHILVTLHSWYREFERIPNLEEFKEFYDTVNITKSRALKQNVLETIDLVYSTELFKDDALEFLIKEHIKQEIARKIGQNAASVLAGETNSFDATERLINDFRENAGVSDGDFNPINTDVDFILEGLKDNTKWTFNLPVLAERVPGIGPGIFTHIFARPEMGKTAFWVSLTAAPLGFAEQGAVVHAFINEEPAVRTLARSLYAISGMPLDDVQNNRQQATEYFSKIRDKLKYTDCSGMTMEELDAHAERYHPDILVTDQLDKFGIAGEFAGTHEKIRAIYVRAREIAKRHGLSFISIGQASADADGQNVLNFTWAENSRTGKAAEVDLIIGIGNNGVMANNYRHISILKNKINGNHDNFGCILNTPISRYEA